MTKGDPHQEPIGRTVSGTPFWAGRFALWSGKTRSLIYYKHNLEGVSWPCSRCGSRDGLHLVAQRRVPRRAWGYWFECSECRLHLTFGHRFAQGLQVELGMVPQP